MMLNVYKNGVMNINVASNNFGDHYINGILFWRLRRGNGHGAEYWNDEVQIFTDYLLEVKMLLQALSEIPKIHNGLTKK